MRLNKASVTGFFCCFGTILFGIATNGGIKTILNFLHVPSLIVTMGGTLFAVMITSDSLDDYIIGVKGLPYAFTRSMANASEIITSIYDLSEIARKEGLLALEEKAVQINGKQSFCNRSRYVVGINYNPLWFDYCKLDLYPCCSKIVQKK